MRNAAMKLFGNIWAAVGLLVLTSLAAGACSQQLDEIDRVQPNYVAKQDLEGEWYYRSTVIDTPFASAYTFVGDQGKMERGTFEVQENSLIFYRTYEFQYNAEEIGLKPEVNRPYLRWLAEDEAIYTANPYQSRDQKFAEGEVLKVAGGASLACDGQSTDDGGKMHEFCQQNGPTQYAYCGHDKNMAFEQRTHANAVCVAPTKFVYRGAPLAVFPIQKHFDIKFSYNPSTGEKTNVRGENSSDRFWYEREFIRVDWADNNVVNYQFTMSSLLSWVILPIFEGDAAPEGEGLRMFRDESDSVTYFDYVSKFILEPPQEYYDDWGTNVPICVFYPWYKGGVFECTSEQIKTRSAFMKVDQNDTYRPETYDDRAMEKFGYFREERLSYDELYDVTYSGVIRNIKRFDIWSNHQYDANGKAQYDKMTPKPVVYYISKDFPRDLVPQAAEVAKQWSKPFEDVVKFFGHEVPKHGMFVLCENNNTTAQEAADAGAFVAETDPEVCADMDFVKENGDIRYSFMYTVVEPLENAPMGFGPSSADPLTGKILTASAYLYLGSVDIYADYGTELVETMVGYRDYVTVVDSLDHEAQQYVAQLKVGNNPFPGSVEEAKERARTMVREDVRRRVAVMGAEKSDQDFAGMRMDLLKADTSLDRAMIDDAFRSIRRDPTVRFGLDMDAKTADRVALRNWANNRGVKEVRDRMLSDALKTIDREGFVDESIIGLAEEWRNRYDGEICKAVSDAMGKGEELSFDLSAFEVVKEACTAEQEGQRRVDAALPALTSWQEYDPKVKAVPEAGDTCTKLEQGTVTGYYWVNTCTVAKLGALVSQKLLYTEAGDQQLYWKPSPWYAATKDVKIAKTQQFVRALAEGIRLEMVQDFRTRIFLSLTLHEVGHTLGLRHNFEASSDAMNYPKEYWGMKVAQDANGDYVAVDPFKPETDAQQAGRMRELQYSSIMDYGKKFNDLWYGLGLYDHAAIRFGYGGIVDVFNKTPDLETWMPYMADPADDFPGDVPPVADPANPVEALFKRIHFTQIPNVMNGIDGIYDRKQVALDSIMGNACATDADCGANGGCPNCTVCKAQMGKHYCAPKEVVEVPYRFCGDEYAGRTPYCDVWDQGADPYEIVRNAATDYWTRFLIYGRWRGRVLFSPDRYSESIMHLFDQFKRQYQWWAVQNMRFNQGDWWEGRFGTPWDQDENAGLASSMAAFEAFNTLIQVFAIPSGNYPDTRLYGYNGKKGRYETWTSYNDRELSSLFILEENFGSFSARPMYPMYQSGGDEMFPVSGGAIYDRLNAFVALCDPSSDFLNIDEVPDNRQYLISFYTFFPERMLHLLGGLTTHREANYAPCVVEDPTTKKPISLRVRDPQNMDDPNFCVDGHFLEPEDVDYDFPTTWYRIPMLAAYFGMSLMINDYDRRFMDTTRVFLEGHEEELDVPEELKIRAKDPLSGKVYVAYKMGQEGEFDTAYNLVAKLNTIFEGFDSMEELQAEYQAGTGELSKTLSLIELLRGLHRVYDYTTLGPMAVTPAE